MPRTSVASTERNPGLRSTTLRPLLGRALRILGFPRATVSLVLTGDERIRSLNRDFLEVDRPTDVLSFPLAEPGDLADRDRDLYLGEIYISVETARAQAKAARRPLRREIAHLAIHGLLHLVGHDHATASERRRMRAAESRLLRELAPML
ncbi:MAG TPA: rRNA maturation RNase YbeY [Candidatus Eisenbacteria bacterium]